MPYLLIDLKCESLNVYLIYCFTFSRFTEFSSTVDITVVQGRRVILDQMSLFIANIRQTRAGTPHYRPDSRHFQGWLSVFLFVFVGGFFFFIIFIIFFVIHFRSEEAHFIGHPGLQYRGRRWLRLWHLADGTKISSS